MTGQVSEAVARPARTAIQLIPAGAIVEFVDAFFYDMSDRQYAALLALLTLLIGFVQTTIENSTGKALLRKVPPYEAPVVDDGGKV